MERETKKRRECFLVDGSWQKAGFAAGNAKLRFNETNYQESFLKPKSNERKSGFVEI